MAQEYYLILVVVELRWRGAGCGSWVSSAIITLVCCIILLVCCVIMGPAANHTYVRWRCPGGYTV